MAEPFGNGGSYESLESRYRHLDDRVGRLGQEVAGISATLGQVSHMLETISRRVNEPQRTQWSAIIAACAFVASLGYSSLMPVQKMAEANAEQIESVKLRQRDVAEQMGEFVALSRVSDGEHSRAQRLLEESGYRISDLAAKTAEQGAQIEALENKLRDVDMAGSRKWVNRND